MVIILKGTNDETNPCKAKISDRKLWSTYTNNNFSVGLYLTVNNMFTNSM